MIHPGFQTNARELRGSDLQETKETRAAKELVKIGWMNTEDVLTLRWTTTGLDDADLFR